MERRMPTTPRLDAAMGIVFVMLVTAALLLPGQPPKAEDTAATVAALLIEKRTAFLVGGYIGGLSSIAFLWFIAAVRDHLDRQGTTQLASAAFAGGIVAMTLMLVGIILIDGVAFVTAGVGDPAIVRAANDMGTFALETSKFGFALFILAVSRSGRSTDALPRWLARLGIGFVAVLLPSAFALVAEHGVFQFGGVIDLAGGLLPPIWIVALSVVMMRPGTHEAVTS